MPRMKALEGFAGIKGYRAMGVAAGIKKGRPDVAVIVSDVEGTQGAAVFTQNAFAAAPVHVSRQHVADGHIQAVVINSGCANACTGRQGLRDAVAMADAVAAGLGIASEQVLVCSTGRIGVRLPMDKVHKGIAQAISRLDEAQGGEVSRAILTTDTGPKEARATFSVNRRTYTIAGIAKGAGMIHPNMATMLSVMVTDAPVPARHLRQALQTAVDASFNQISVDGDESTNDTCILLANGAAGGPALKPATTGWKRFQAALDDVCTTLAKRIAGDGEGATRLLHVHVTGARDIWEARSAARAVARSNLVKSAIHGADPNWGRILSAIGSTRSSVGTVDVRVGSPDRTLPVLEDNEPVADVEPARALLGGAEVLVEVDLGSGTAEAWSWGCDLTQEYVHFNSAYTT